MTQWPNGETRAYVGTDFGRWHGLAITLATGLGNGNYALGEPTEIVFTEQTDENRNVEQPPTLRIPDHVGRALLEALSAHYGGVADVRQNREDLLAERKRVDGLIDVVCKVALTPPSVLDFRGQS